MREKRYELRKNSDFNKIAEYWACSKALASWLFGERISKEKLFITYPTIDAREFLYSEEIRRQYRERMGINAEYIVGSVGRLVYQKNYSFILEAFSEEFKMDEEVKLLIIGRGEQEKELRKRAWKSTLKKQRLIPNENRMNAVEMIENLIEKDKLRRL